MSSTVAAPPGRWTGLRAPLSAAAVVGAAALALHVRDPHQQGSWGFCPFKALTGWDCPGCGGLRAVNDLGNGHLVDAAHSNLLLVASLPLLVAWWAGWVVRAWRSPGGAVAAVPGPRLVATYAVLMVVFTVLRNTPWGAGLHVA